MEKRTVIQVLAVSKKFKDVNALNNVSFAIKENTIFGLLGSNGAGKSTMMHILTGLVNPTNGSVEILGNRIGRKYPRSLKRRVAIVPQKISLYEDLTILDNLYFFGRAYGIKGKELKRRIDVLSSLLLLGNLRRPVKNLSGGYQRRVSIAVALIGDPEILIFDEALVGIDLETNKIILDLLKTLKQTKTILFTTHSMSEAQSICDYVCFLHKGRKIKEGKTKDVLLEYALNHGSRILITFDSEEMAKQVADDLRIKNANISLDENVVTIESLSGEYNISNVIKFLQEIKEYKSTITDIEIEKPGLGEVMLDLIKREGA